MNYDDARKAVELCLSNAESFLQDAELMIKNKRTVNVAVPIEIAMEEIGKAQIMVNKMSDGLDSVNVDDLHLTEKDGVFDHPRKLQAAISLISLPLEEDGEIDDRFNARDCPFIKEYLFELKSTEEKELRDRAKAGHASRLESCYVDFDEPRRRAFLSKPKYDYTFPLLINALEWAIRKVEMKLV